MLLLKLVNLGAQGVQQFSNLVAVVSASAGQPTVFVTSSHKPTQAATQLRIVYENFKRPTISLASSC